MRVLFVLTIITCVLSLDVPPCGGGGSTFTPWMTLVNSVDGNETQRRTRVRLCHDGDVSGITVQFDVQDTSNPVTHAVECNKAPFPYQENAVEMFVGASFNGAEGTTHYLELEVSPHGVMFQASIQNPDGVCGKFGTQYLDCNESGIRATVAQTPLGWNATILVPRDVIPGDGYIFANFFRIDMINSAGQKEFQALNPTLKSPPCFHVPARFIDLEFSSVNVF